MGTLEYTALYRTYGMKNGPGLGMPIRERLDEMMKYGSGHRVPSMAAERRNGFSGGGR